MSDFWRDRPVLITGANGFLGNWLGTRLKKLGAETTCVIRNGPSRVWCSTAVYGDVTDQALMERAIVESRAKTVFHLAAQAQVGVGNLNPVSTFDTNVRGTWSVLEACRRSPLVEQVIVSSSDKAYGEQPRLPYTEDMPLLGIHPYDASKACADRLAQTYASQWGLPVAITRCGNLFGGGDRTWSRLVPGTIRRLLKGDRPVVRGDGSAVRDWLYVEDAVDAYLMLAERMRLSDKDWVRDSTWPHGKGFNLSLGIKLTVVDVVDRIVMAMGLKTWERESTPSSPGEIQEQTLDCSLAKRVFNWYPKHTFAEGLEKTVAWYRENL